MPPVHVHIPQARDQKLAARVDDATVCSVRTEAVAGSMTVTPTMASGALLGSEANWCAQAACVAANSKLPSSVIIRACTFIGARRKEMLA